MDTSVKSRKPKRRIDWLKLAPRFDALVSQYKVPGYIENDPIRIPHRFVQDARTCELVAFITALFSYGRREAIIETVSNLIRIMDNDPVVFVENFQAQRDARLFQHFVYRFNKAPDVVFLLQRLQWVYREFGSLEDLFEACLKAPGDVKSGIAGFTDALLGENPPDTYGLKFLFAHPQKGGACKRFNMFLRWMVREDRDPGGRVDFGLWKRALRPADLLVPLDTHVLKMNGHLGFSSRKDNSWQTAEEITRVFRLLCPEDPVKYDYALFGFSLDKRPPAEILSIL